MKENPIRSLPGIPVLLAILVVVAGCIWMFVHGVSTHSGAPLVVVESMKMEVTVEAPCAGTVAEVLCREGKPVSAGQAVVILREATAINDRLRSIVGAKQERLAAMMRELEQKAVLYRSRSDELSR